MGEGLSMLSPYMSNIERFDLGRSIRFMIYFSFWVCIFFVVLSLSLPFTAQDGRPHNPVFIAGLSLFGTVFFGIWALYAWKYIRELPYTSVSLDEQGIWKTTNERSTSIVAWSKIASLRERPYLQRLDLLDKSGHLLLKAEYQLHNFERLRTLVIERSALYEQALDRSFPKLFFTMLSLYWLLVALRLFASTFGPSSHS
jgi:hypothetical protein